MSTFGLQPTDMKITCHTFQCHNRAAYFIGRPDSPRGTEYYVCDQCANELIENVVNSVEFIEEPENKKTEIEMLLDKPVSEWTVAELKDKAEEIGLPVKSKMNKADLIRLFKMTKAELEQLIEGKHE